MEIKSNIDPFYFPEILFLTEDEVSKFKAVMAKVIVLVREYEAETGRTINSFTVDMDEARKTIIQPIKKWYQFWK